MVLVKDNPLSTLILMKHFSMKKISEYWNLFLANPKAIFWIYVLVNLVPSVCLVFTEPYNMVGKLLLILYPLALYFILFTLSKNTGLIQLLLIPLLVLHAFQIVVFYLYGEDVIAVDMFLNVATTSVSEASELLGGIILSVLFVGLLYIPTMIISWKEFRRKVYLPKAFRRVMFFTGVGVLALSYVLMFGARNLNTGTFSAQQDLYPANMFYNLDFAIHKWVKINRYNETSKDFTFEARQARTADRREVYVLVIGETGRADNWSLYGYERPTTPYMEKDPNVVCFPDAITQSNTTHKSVSIMLSAASAENYQLIYDQKSILTAFKESGFKTVFLSNQPPNHSFTDFFSQEADVYRNYTSGSGGVNRVDGEMLPELEHCIDSISGNLFVVLHTYGSHFNYRERYPEEFSRFRPDQVTKIKASEREVLLNAYDNTILYTDYFLHQVTGILSERDLCSAMVYATDHGEDILDDGRMRFLHASPSPTYYQLKIPFLIWFSDVYKANFPENHEHSMANRELPVATNAVFHTLLDMAHIQTLYFDDDLSLVNSNFEKTKRLYLGDHDDPIFFYNAGLKRQDKEMIQKQQMYY